MGAGGTGAAGIQASLERKAADELDAEMASGSLIARLESFVVGGFALGALGLSTYNVVVRYFDPSLMLELVEEVQVYLIVWAVFLALGAVTRTDRHVKADLFVSMLPPRVARGLAAFTEVLGLAFALLLAYLGIGIAWQAYDFGDVSITSLRFPLWIYIAALPAGALTMAAGYAVRIAHLVRHRRRAAGTGETSDLQQERRT